MRRVELNGEPLSLTPTEYDLLKVFISYLILMDFTFQVLRKYSSFFVFLLPNIDGFSLILLLSKAV